MNRRRIKLPHIRRVTVGANEIAIFVECFQFLADVQPEPILVMTFGAGRNRDVRLQTAQRCCLSDVDVTAAAFLHVLLACMTKLQ